MNSCYLSALPLKLSFKNAKEKKDNQTQLIRQNTSDFVKVFHYILIAPLLADDFIF